MKNSAGPSSAWSIPPPTPSSPRPLPLPILATALTPNGRIQKLQFYNGNTLHRRPRRPALPLRLGQARARRIQRSAPRLTDSAGVTALSESDTLTITGKGDGSLLRPWGDFYIANNDSKTPGTASQNGDAFKIKNARRHSRQRNRARRRPVRRPASDRRRPDHRPRHQRPSRPDDDISGAMAGITIRENLKNRCKQYSMLYGQPGEESVASFVRRQDHWMNPTVSEKADEGPRLVQARPPRPARLRLHQHRRQGLGTLRHRTLRSRARSLCRPGRLHPRRQAAPPPRSSTTSSSSPARGARNAVKGFVTRGGTFVAADVFAIDENLVRYIAKRQSKAPSPSTRSPASSTSPFCRSRRKLSPGHTGVLMSTGDFLEGECTASRTAPSRSQASSSASASVPPTKPDRRRPSRRLSRENALHPHHHRRLDLPPQVPQAQPPDPPD